MQPIYIGPKADIANSLVSIHTYIAVAWAAFTAMSLVLAITDCGGTQLPNASDPENNRHAGIPKPI